jgi:glycosyltransferase involved in cell wall biosynthesis
VIAGDGAAAPALKRLAQGLPSVHFAGWVSSGQIRYLLSKSDVGLVAVSGLASTSVPNKSFEYMSGGLLLLNSTTGDLRQLIEGERIGCNYPNGDARQLAARIQNLLQRPEEVREMKQRSRALFLERFEAGKVYGAMADKLTALAAKGF